MVTSGLKHVTASMILSILSSRVREAKTSGWYNYRMMKPPLAPSRKSLWEAAHENDPDIKQTDQRMNLC